MFLIITLTVLDTSFETTPQKYFYNKNQIKPSFIVLFNNLQVCNLDCKKSLEPEKYYF